MAQLYSALDFGSSGYRLESCRGHKGRVKNRAKAMIYHLPFLHSHTHSHSFHPCDSVILVFVFFRFRSVFSSLSWNAQNLIDHYVIIMWSLERWFGQNWPNHRILFPIKPLILNESTHKKKSVRMHWFFLWVIPQNLTAYALSERS